jgi:hypothetical protein
MRVGEIRRGWDNNRFTALVSKRVPAQISLQLLPLQLLEVTRIQRKFIRMILTSTKKFIKLPEVGESGYIPDVGFGRQLVYIRSSKPWVFDEFAFFAN